MHVKIHQIDEAGKGVSHPTCGIKVTLSLKLDKAPCHLCGNCYIVQQEQDNLRAGLPKIQILVDVSAASCFFYLKLKLKKVLSSFCD
jgi:hypothetical protein